MRRGVALCLFAALIVGHVAGFGGDAEPVDDETGFPSFITPNDEYYVTRIGSVPEIDAESYRLEITGLVETPKSFSLEELYSMELEELPLTVECIGNAPEGQLLSTAVWKGIRLGVLLEELGVSDAATGVRYMAADGYYASHTMEQIEENDVLVALHMNGEPIPPLHGFPVRVLNPGFYGVKQPAWVTSIEVIDRPLEDYWDDRGWDVSPPMAIDSKIFAPVNRANVETNEPIRVTGAAFGGTRVAKVEVTTDYGETWIEAEIVEQLDADNTWVFWEVEISFPVAGSFGINARATDINGNTQEESDPERLDGTNDWPFIRVNVRRGDT